MKKIGIALDNYKVRKFTRALKAAGYQNLEIVPLMDNVTLIRIPVTEETLEQHKKAVGKICKKLQIDFNQSN